MGTEIETEHLFFKDSIFITQKKSVEEIFKEISTQLVAKKLVKDNFFENLLIREKNFPTGLDLSVIDSSLPNIAIPHTEGEFVNTRRVVPIKLMYPVTFNNMIDPTKQVEVNFLFMILNNDPVGQANVLSEIMGFLSSTIPVKKVFSIF